MSVRVAIADDQALVRAGLRMILDAASDMEVVAEASDGRDAVSVVRRDRPDILLMDVRMPVVDGIRATREITATSGNTTQVVILTRFDLDDYVYAALRAGAGGFLLKDVGPEQLLDAIRTVHAADALLAPSVTRRLIERFATMSSPAPAPAPPGVKDLTPREVEIFSLVARGLPNSAIADRLGVSGATVKTHVNRIFAKLDLHDRVQAVVLGYETGLVVPGDAGPDPDSGQAHTPW